MKANIAKLLYETYCAAVLTASGPPKATWDELIANEEKYLDRSVAPFESDAWLKVAEVVPLALLGEGMFSNRITAEKIKHLCESGMVITGIVATKLHCPHEEGLVAIVDKGAVRWLKKDEAWDLMHTPCGGPPEGGAATPPYQAQIADWKLQIEKLSLAPGDIVLITIPKEVPMSPPVRDSLKKTFSGLLAGKEVRLLLRNADIALDVFADLLTADDLHRILERMDRKKLAEPVAPEQNQTT